MYLVEIFLPVTDNDGHAFAPALFVKIQEELAEMFDGITAFSRVPAHGESRSGSTLVHDDIIVYEVMTDTLDTAWWSEYRRKLEKLMSQEKILIRATQITQL